MRRIVHQPLRFALQIAYTIREIGVYLRVVLRRPYPDQEFARICLLTFTTQSKPSLRRRFAGGQHLGRSAIRCPRAERRIAENPESPAPTATPTPDEMAKCIFNLEKAARLLEDAHDTESDLAMEVNSELYWARKPPRRWPSTRRSTNCAASPRRQTRSEKSRARQGHSGRRSQRSARHAGKRRSPQRRFRTLKNSPAPTAMTTMSSVCTGSRWPACTPAPTSR